MELARRQAGPRFLSLAVRSLTRAQEASAVPLPVVSALLAQAVASSGAKEKWAKNLQSEWFSWPAGFFLESLSLFLACLPWIAALRVVSG